MLWVDINDGKPEPNKNVLTWAKNKKGGAAVCVASMDEDGTWHSRGSLGAVLFWGPLPDGPAPAAEYLDSYLNRDNKTLGAVLEGIRGWSEAQLRNRSRNDARVRSHLIPMYEEATAALLELVDGLNRDAQRSIDLMADNCAIKTVPKTSPEAKRDFQIVDPVPLLTIANTATEHECAFCTKSRAEMRKCELRAALAQCGIVSDSATQGDCPYCDEAETID